ncbi:MAG: hypothetical protein AABX75_01965 [Nanoarchaeota archaeon]
MKTDAQLRLFASTADLVRGRYETANKLLDLLHEEFTAHGEGTIGKELFDLESQLKTWEGVGDPEVLKYIDLHRLRSYLNLRRELGQLEQKESVASFDNARDLWTDDADIRAYVKKSNRLKRWVEKTPEETQRYANVYFLFCQHNFALGYLQECSLDESKKKRLARAIEKATSEIAAPENLQAAINKFVTDKTLREKTSDTALDTKIAEINIALDSLKAKNDAVAAFAEVFVGYNDRRHSAIDLAHKLIYVILGNAQIAATYKDIHYLKGILATDGKALAEFERLDKLNDEIVDRIAALKKSKTDGIKIAFEEAWFDFSNHYQAARLEADDKIDFWRSNQDFVPVLTDAGDGDGD